MTRALLALALTSTLVHPSTPVKLPDADGFLRRWLILEPTRVAPQLTESAVRALVKTDPFANQSARIPSDGQSVLVGTEPVAWHAVDTLLYNVNLYHFAFGLKKPTSNVLFWVVTVVRAPREMTNVRFAVGSNAASVWWVNDREVIGLYNDRQSVIDDGVSTRLTLTAGTNVIRGAVVNAGGATDFCARFLDSNDRPVRDLAIDLTSATR